MFRFRQRGAGEDEWFDPKMDITNMFPIIVRNVLATLDDVSSFSRSFPFDHWALKYHIKEKAMDDVSEMLAAFVLTAETYETFLEAVKECKLSLADHDAVMLFLAGLGWRVMEHYHKGISSRSVDSRKAIVKPEILKKTLEGFEFRYGGILTKIKILFRRITRKLL